MPKETEDQSKTSVLPELTTNALLDGEFYWVKYHNKWEVAMHEDGLWWLVASAVGKDPVFISEIGKQVIREI